MVYVELVATKKWYTDPHPPCAHVGNVCKEATSLRFVYVNTEGEYIIRYACPVHSHEVPRALLKEIAA